MEAIDTKGIYVYDNTKLWKDKQVIPYIVRSLLDEPYHFISSWVGDEFQVTILRKEDEMIKPDFDSLFNRAEAAAWTALNEDPYRTCGNSTDDYDR